MRITKVDELKALEYKKETLHKTFNELSKAYVDTVKTKVVINRETNFEFKATKTVLKQFLLEEMEEANREIAKIVNDLYGIAPNDPNTPAIVPGPPSKSNKADIVW